MSMFTKRKDRFWKFYVLMLIIFALSAILFVLFFLKIKTSETGIVNKIPNLKEKPLQVFPFVELPDIYRDFLARGWENWSWDSDVNFLSPDFPEHGKSIKIVFKKPNAGFMIYAPHFDTAKYKTINVDVYLVEEDKNKEIFIEFADKNNKILGRQPIFWYADDKKLSSQKWHEIKIPLINLNASYANIGGISLSSAVSKTIYIDNIKFVKDETPFPKWSENTDLKKEEYTPLVILPYSSNFYYKINDWRAVAGLMQVAFSKMRLETGSSTNYGLFLLEGSDFLTDFKYTIFIDWALGDSINLLARYSPDNFFSCSFFDEGINVTLYESRDGKLKALDSAPNFIMERRYKWTSTKSLGIEVKKDSISCLTNGEVKVAHKASYPVNFMGAVGIEIWSPEKGQSSMLVDKVTIEKI